MQKKANNAGTIIFILTIPYGIYAFLMLIFTIFFMIYNPPYSSPEIMFFLFDLNLFGYISIFLIGIFALPFFQKRRNLLLIPLAMMSLSFAFSSVSSLVTLYEKSGLSNKLDPAQTIHALQSPIVWFSYVLLSFSIILYFLTKKIRVILPILAIVISLIVNIGINAVYFTSWYSNLFPEDLKRAVILNSMVAVFSIIEALYFNLIFLLLLIFIMPYCKNKEEPQLMPADTEASA